MKMNEVMNVSDVTEFMNHLIKVSKMTESPALNETNGISDVSFHPITEVIEQYIIPVLCIAGFIMNTVASIVFLQRPLRDSSCGIFLAARGFSDNGFLSTLLIIWISRTFNLNLGTLSGSCRIVIFLSYVCGCVSVWLVVFVTIENYIRICRPFVVSRLCKPTSATAALFLVCALTVGIYSFPFWAMSPDECIPYSEFYLTVHALIYTDTVITLVIPFILISVIMTAIVCDLIKTYRRRRKRTSATRRLPNTMAKVTKMLFAVTVSFLLLSLPSHVYRIQHMLSSIILYKKDDQGYSQLDEAVQQITLLIYYMSLSLNITVYLTFGSKFRKGFKNTFCNCYKVVDKIKLMLTADNGRKMKCYRSIGMQTTSSTQKTTL